MKAGFIGLGQQGKYLAINLVQAGYDLMVYDVRREPLEELARAGATIADSPRANREVVREGQFTTSRKPDDIPAFNRAIIQAFGLQT
jgi:6-phosphogluconate dehydrogenase (decarboxylating)